jgi:hypothetical protein
MAILPTYIRILFTNYDIIAYFLNLASCSEHFIGVKHRILATFNINKKNLFERLYVFKKGGVLFPRVMTSWFHNLYNWAHYKSANLGINGPYRSAKNLPVFLMSNYYKNNKNIIWICSYLFPMYFERHFYTLSVKLFRIPLGNDLQLVSNMNWVHVF